MEVPDSETPEVFSSPVPRIFLAVPFSDEFKAEAGKCQEALKRVFVGVHWIPIENLHLTVKFFGETKLEKIEKILRGIDEIVAPQPRMNLAFNGYGYFGSPRSPRVLFLKGTSMELIGLAEKVLKKFPDERYRPFKAHLTLGKFLKRQSSEELRHNESVIRKWQESSSSAIGLAEVSLSAEVTELVLMETIWIGRSVVYEARHRFPLGRR